MNGADSFITVVSGLPRSGTSLMMQMLHAGGMLIVTDRIRAADVDNPRGYFEFEPVKGMGRDAAWLADARGSAVKVVYALLRDLPPDLEYRVILMQRDLKEVVASQRAMLERSGRQGANLSDAQLALLFEREMESIRDWLARRTNFTVLEIQYRDCLESAALTAARVNEYLGGGLNEAAMSAEVIPALYRQRA